MKISITFFTGNSAFDDNPDEIERILTKVGQTVSNQIVGKGAISDRNGALVGRWEVSETTPEDYTTIENWNRRGI